MVPSYASAYTTKWGATGVARSNILRASRSSESTTFGAKYEAEQNHAAEEIASIPNRERNFIAGKPFESMGCEDMLISLGLQWFIWRLLSIQCSK